MRVLEHTVRKPNACHAFLRKPQIYSVGPHVCVDAENRQLEGIAGNLAPALVTNSGGLGFHRVDSRTRLSGPVNCLIHGLP